MTCLKLDKYLIIKAFCISIILVLISNTSKGSNYLTLNSEIIKVSIINSDTLSFYKDIKIRKALKLVKENIENPYFIILDVRGLGEFSEGHIPNAININYKSEDFKDRLDSLDKEKTYLVYCVAGYRSKKSMNMMKEKGFKYVYNMKGGMMKWKSKKFPLEKEDV
ncbi:MAG: rhodanese-like domain-containing protein [Tenuifilaceae bacterium]